MRTNFFVVGLGLLVSWGTVAAQGLVTLKISGGHGAPSYVQEVLGQALKEAGFTPRFELQGEFPVMRREALLASGELTVAVMGETDERNSRFLPIHVGLTGGLQGKRILFIPQGAQKLYDGVKSLEDFRRLRKVAGMGSPWADVAIWRANHLPVVAVDGNWKVLFRQVASGRRGVDYLPRGVNEILAEWPNHRELVMETHLVLVYRQDQILYLSPRHPELLSVLRKALEKARDSGLIQRLAAHFYRSVEGPPINLGRRVQIRLTLP